MQKSKQRSVAVLLFPQFSNFCLANAVEPLRAANQLSRRGLYRWRYLGIDGSALASSSGLPVQPEARLADDPGGDLLLVMPSYGYEEHGTPACLRALRAASGRFRMLAGMDTGSWLIAAAGLLDGHRATVHWDVLSRFAERFPAVDVVEDRFVIGPDRASCGGATTALDLMLALIERDHGAMLSLEVAALFMHGERDPRLDPAIRLPSDRITRAAAALMRRHLEQPMAIAEIASRLEMGQRALELHFRRQTGLTPGRVYRSIRLAEARRLTEETRLGVAEIAARCGYGDATAMTRAFKAEFGMPPTALRRGSA